MDVEAVAVKPMDDAGVHLDKDEHTEVVVEHVAGSVTEVVGAKDRAEDGFKKGWLETPSLLVEGRLREDWLCTLCSRLMSKLVLVDTFAKENEVVFVDTDEHESKGVLVEMVLVVFDFTVVFFTSFLFSDFKSLISNLDFFTLFSRFSHFCSNLIISLFFSLTILFSRFRSFFKVSVSIAWFFITFLRVSF